MFNFKGSRFSAFIADQVFSYNETFTEDDGFRIAIGFDPGYGAELDGESFYDYLDLSVNIYKADFTKNPPEEILIKLDLHTCTDEDFEQFYPVKDSHVGSFDRLKSSLKCFDSSQVEISGDWNSDMMSSLNIHVKIKKEHCRNYTNDLECFGDKNVEEKIATYFVIF